MTDILPLMPKATAVWLIDNTTLTFRQIAEFCGMHELEISGIADGEVAVGIKGLDPVQNNQLAAEEIVRCEGDPVARLRLRSRSVAPAQKKKPPRYVPVSKRQDRPSAIAWLVRYHPEIETRQIAKLVGSTKPTIEAIRNRTHWNSANIQPVDPVALGLCSQVDLDAIVAKAAEKKAKVMAQHADETHQGLMPTEESLAPLQDEPLIPADATAESVFAERASDAAADPDEEPAGGEPILDPDALFNLPKGGPAEGD